MKKSILTIIFASIYIFTLSASDIPFFKSLFMSNEEYVKQQILKCKDVESVEFEKSSDYPEDDTYDIYVYLTNNRFISFSGIELYHYKSAIGRWSPVMLQINDLMLVKQAFEPVVLSAGPKVEYVCSFTICTEIRFMSELTKKKELNNIINIIGNIDYIYDYINSLPKLPADTPNFVYFNGDYDKEMEIPKELENDVPFSIIEQKEYYNSTFKFLRKYEER
ncbi:MAG: hypothetical protein MJ196_05710 [Treponemataceae bacterium]|nr:hypothetical protein [Treponemataceae bacterium]